jgi:DamX protein
MVYVTPTPILIGERIQQLDMLLHIQEFSSMVAIVTGQSKMGKTALIESAATQLAIHHQVISFSAVEVQSETDVIHFVSQQLGVSNSWAAIEESLINIHVQSESVNVVIDDAHLLSYELLQMLTVRAVQEDGWHLVLAGDSTLVEKLTHIQQDLHHSNLIHHIDLVDISQEEAMDLACEFFKRNGHESVPISTQKLAQLWQLSHGVPGALIDLLEGEKDQNMADAAKFPFGHVAAICLIGIALTFSYLYQDDAEAGQDVIDNILASQDRTQTIMATEEKPIPEVVDNSVPSLKPLTSLKSLTSLKPAASPVDISSNMVTTKTKPALAVSQKTKVKPAVKMQKPKPTQVAQVKKAVQHPLLKAPSAGFALQLVGVRSKSSANAVLEDFKGALGADKLSIYETTFKGQPWFVVVYGPMSDKVSAKQKAGTLAKRLKNQPWVRPMASIQEDIRKIQ